MTAVSSVALTTAPPLPADVSQLVQPLTTALDAALCAVAVLLAALVAALWLLHRRARTGHRWQLAYWHLMATARCGLCGSRMEPEPHPPTEPARLREAPPTARGKL